MDRPVSGHMVQLKKLEEGDVAARALTSRWSTAIMRENFQAKLGRVSATGRFRSRAFFIRCFNLFGHTQFSQICRHGPDWTDGQVYPDWQQQR
jgi:hypothetical protein